MKDQNELLKKYHDGTLSEKDQQRLETLIETGEVSLDDIEEYVAVSEYLSQVSRITHGPSMDDKFFSMLQKERGTIENIPNKGARWIKWLFMVIIAGGMFWAGTQLGNKTQSEIENNSEEFASTLLNTDDISDKIHLVSTHDKIDMTDEKVIKALLFTLNNDESNNVRLACIDALMNYSYIPAVRAGLVTAISSQNSAAVLSSLADAINTSGNRITTQDLTDRINKELPPPVKESILKNLVEL